MKLRIDIPHCDICFIPLDEQDVSDFARYFHCDSKSPQDFFQKWKMYGVAQSVEHPTLAQVMISWFVGSSPELGSVLTAQSLEPASDTVSLSLLLLHSVSVSVSVSVSLSLSFSLKNK